jgi:DNA-directed RNA polymerase specialized sigma24 family protein
MAEDIPPSLLLKALSAEEDIRSPGRAKAWFYRVLGKRVIDAGRRFAVAARTFAGESDARSFVPAAQAGRTSALAPAENGRICAREQVETGSTSVQELARREGIGTGNAWVQL